MGSRGWSGSCTPDAWGRGAGTTRAAERVLHRSVLTGALPRWSRLTMVVPYVPGHGSITMRSSPPQFSPRHDVLVHGVPHHARRQRRLWPIRSVDPSAFTVTTTLGRAPCAWFPPCMTMETGSLVKDGNRVTHQTGPAARSRASSSGSDHRCRDHWRCQGCWGRRC